MTNRTLCGLASILFLGAVPLGMVGNNELRMELDKTRKEVTLSWEGSDGVLEYLLGESVADGWQTYPGGGTSPAVATLPESGSSILFRLVKQSEPIAVLVDEILISEKGMYFDGNKVASGDAETYVDQPKYDRVFGDTITPHGDCIDRYKNYVFLTWYRGPESDRHVMLSRYNLATKTLKTIEFDHRHTGFLNNPNLGEAHNVIGVGICEIDDTIHLLYDMHAYSRTKPADGSLADDYFRYQVSIPGAATVADDEFGKSLFKPKQLYLKEGENYEGFTYPKFFNNKKGELFVNMRQGGHNNGSYLFAKYDGSEWTNWREFNVLNARFKGYSINWGLYGEMKFEGGKLGVGFLTRLAIGNDPYLNNNGFYYAYTTDPEGLENWFNVHDEPINIPVLNPMPLKLAEPGDVFADQSANAINFGRDADWTVTPGGAVHFSTEGRGGSVRAEIHTYRKAGETEFTTTTDFPGGELHSMGEYVFLANREDGIPVIYRAPGGTNNWEEIYRAKSDTKYRAGVAMIKKGQLHFYLMEEKTGSAQPIYLQVFDLPQ